MRPVLFWLTDAEAQAFLREEPLDMLDALEGAARDTCARVRCDIRIVHDGQYLADVMYDAAGCSNIVLPERRRCCNHRERPSTHVDTIGYGWCLSCANSPAISGRGLVRKRDQLANCGRCQHSAIIHDQEGCPVEDCDCCLDENGTPPAEGM